MNCTALVEIISWNGVIFDYFDDCRLSRFLVVLNSATVSIGLRPPERSTHDSAILRFKPGIAIFSCVKNSVLSTQLSKGSASCGELTPKENQSSFNVDVPTYLMAPREMVLSEEICSWRFTRAWTIMYTFLFV